jgi:hypothetical protein
LHPRDRKYLIARAAAINAAIEDLQSFAQSPRERAALELLVATRDKIAEVLAQPTGDAVEPPSPSDV